jgi:hypothetical protein
MKGFREKQIRGESLTREENLAQQCLLMMEIKWHRLGNVGVSPTEDLVKLMQVKHIARWKA